MMNSFMLIDSNVLITPYRQYYAFDLAPSFWTQLRVLIEQGTIGILDKVKDEIMASSIKDTLAKWFNELQPPRYIRHEQQEIIMMYSKVLMSIVENPSPFKPHAIQIYLNGRRYQLLLDYSCIMKEDLCIDNMNLNVGSGVNLFAGSMLEKLCQFFKADKKMDLVVSNNRCIPHSSSKTSEITSNPELFMYLIDLSFKFRN
jgi:hypothetical protein